MSDEFAAARANWPSNIRRRPRLTPLPANPYGNRGLSWLDFDARVLELAAEESLPLFERLFLCSIASSNLDEFFAVSVAGLRQKVAAGITQPFSDGRTPAETLAAIRKRVIELQWEQDDLYREGLRPALAAEGIRIIGVDGCDGREFRNLCKRFERDILPLLMPSGVGAAAPFPFVPSLALSLAAIVRDPVSGHPRFVRVNVPDTAPRFVAVGNKGAFVPLEEIIAHFLPRLFGGETVVAQTPFRVTRNADVALAADADDLLEEVELQLRRRRFGEVVRLEVASDVAPGPVEALQRSLGVPDECVYRTTAPIGLAALKELLLLDRPDLKRAPWKPVTQRAFQKRTPADLLARIRRRSLLVHHPYESFETSVQAFVQAARDPKCLALMGTVYRTDDPSPTLESLVTASDSGKQALALVELKARFDERRNVEWSRALEGSGVHVVYGVPELKVHAKLALLVRRERDGIRRYVHIGTGNYHASNASSYEDLSLFTADEAIGADVADVFNAVASLSPPTPFRKLLVSPWYLRDGLMLEFARIADAARAGEQAKIRIKVNSLGDPDICDALYAAASAGVQVEIVVRGICTLRPGIRGLSESITVRSVLGRFLEHSRFYSFRAGDHLSTWVGSADLMPRNLDRRVEVLAPVEDVRLRTQIERIFDELLADTASSWELDGNGKWQRVRGSGPRVSAQERLMARAVKKRG
jgi:polyphosphate kinase